MSERPSSWVMLHSFVGVTVPNLPSATYVFASDNALMTATPDAVLPSAVMLHPFNANESGGYFGLTGLPLHWCQFAAESCDDSSRPMAMPRRQRAGLKITVVTPSVVR